MLKENCIVARRIAEWRGKEMEGKVAIQPVKRVLIFDSDQVFALGLAHFLRNHGWEAIVARGSDEDVAPA